jgi:hypothetical protein
MWSRCPTLRRLFLSPSSRVYVTSVIFARSAGQPPMMETQTVSETSDTDSTLTRLIARENFVVHCHPEGYKSYTTVKHIPGSHRSPSTVRVMKSGLQQNYRYAYAYSIFHQDLKTMSYRTGWSTGNALQLVVFGRYSVRISAGTPAGLKFSWLSSVPQGKFRDSTSISL